MTNPTYSASLLEYLKEFILPERWELLQSRVSERTRHITVALEDIYQPQNASAILRSADCFGIQDVHIIENRNKYEINPKVEKGSHKWLTLHRYREKEQDNSPLCVDSLLKSGYSLIATSPHIKSMDLDSLPLDKPIVIFLGTEMKGLREDTMSRCHHTLRIPMYGFTESLNLSVSAGIIMNRLRSRLEASDMKFKLPMDQQEEVLLDWLRKSLKKAPLLEARFKEMYC